MQIDITKLAGLDQYPLSHSKAEGGEDAGRETWNASLEQASETPLLSTPEELEAMRDFALSSGGWDAEEIAAWDEKEVNALFLQWIAGDCRQCPALVEGWRFVEREPGQWWAESECDEWEAGPFESRSDAYANQIDTARPPRADSLEEIDWPEYEAQASAGRISGNLSRGEDGSISFYLGS